MHQIEGARRRASSGQACRGLSSSPCHRPACITHRPDARPRSSAVARMGRARRFALSAVMEPPKSISPRPTTSLSQSHRPGTTHVAAALSPAGEAVGTPCAPRPVSVRLSWNCRTQIIQTRVQQRVGAAIEKNTYARVHTLRRRLMPTQLDRSIIHPAASCHVNTRLEHSDQASAASAVRPRVHLTPLSFLSLVYFLDVDTLSRSS